MLNVEIGTDAWNKNVKFISASADESVPDCAIWDEEEQAFCWCETPEDESESERISRIVAREQRYG